MDAFNCQSLSKVVVFCEVNLNLQSFLRFIKDKLQQCIKELHRQENYRKENPDYIKSFYFGKISFDPNLLLNWIDHHLGKIAFHSLREEYLSKPAMDYCYQNYEEVDRKKRVEKGEIKECAEKERMYFIIKMCHKFKNPEEKLNFELSQKKRATK